MCQSSHRVLQLEVSGLTPECTLSTFSPSSRVSCLLVAGSRCPRKGCDRQRQDIKKVGERRERKRRLSGPGVSARRPVCAGSVGSPRVSRAGCAPAEGRSPPRPGEPTASVKPSPTGRDWGKSLHFAPGLFAYQTKKCLPLREPATSRGSVLHLRGLDGRDCTHAHTTLPPGPERSLRPCDFGSQVRPPLQVGL